MGQTVQMSDVSVIDRIEQDRRIKPGLKNSTKEAIAGYLFLLPNLTGFLVFTSLPVVASLALSFVKWDLLLPPAFVGMKNFVDLFHDRFFWKFCWNTLYLMMGIPLGMMGSLIVALAMNPQIKGIVFFRPPFFLPTICSGVAIFILWRLLYNPDFGFFNLLIRAFGDLIQVPREGPNGLTEEKWAKPALIIMGLWEGIGGHNMILYLASLQGVPRDLYEAADIDGANSWQKFWAVTWPQISPTTFFIATMSIIGGFQAGFDSAYIMTGGGPNGATTTIVYYIYKNFYEWQQMGYAATISWILFLVIFVVTLVNWKTFGKKVYYY